MQIHCVKVVAQDGDSCTGNGTFWKETLDTFPTSACRLELLNWNYKQLSPPTPDLWACSSPGPSSLLEKLVKCWSSLETWRMSWKCSPLIIIISKQPPARSPPPSRTQTAVIESRFWGSLMPALGNLLHLPKDGPGCTQGAKCALLLTSFSLFNSCRGERCGFEPLGHRDQEPWFQLPEHSLLFRQTLPPAALRER